MSNEPSLLSKIKSKYILQGLLSLAYDDIKSVIKLIKYNKSLLNRLGINIKTIQNLNNYKIKTRLFNNGTLKKKIPTSCLIIILIVLELYEIILLLQYIISFFKKGKLDDIILKKGYNKMKKNFVTFIDKYFLIPYFLFILSSEVLGFLSFACKKFIIKSKKFFIFLVVYIFFYLINSIVIIIKFVFSQNIIQENYLKIMKSTKSRKQLDKNILKLLWFYDYDIAITMILSFKLIISFIFILSMFLKDIGFAYDYKVIFLYQINGVNIFDYMLPLTFKNLKEIEKNKFIFKKEYINFYEYQLNENQIKLIDKINNIRKINNIPKLKYNEINKLPNFVINEKTELFFFPYKNLYEYESSNLYIFKYPKNTFNNFINNEEVLSIITNIFLDQINIVEKDNIEYIYIYNKNKIPDSIQIKRDNTLNDEKSFNNDLENTQLFNNLIKNEN